jgi:hypothetical protein
MGIKSTIVDHYELGHKIIISQESSEDYYHNYPIIFRCSCGYKDEVDAISVLALLDEYIAVRKYKNKSESYERSRDMDVSISTMRPETTQKGREGNG